jgi:hypothetical protein
MYQLQKNEQSGLVLICLSIFVGTFFRPEFLFFVLWISLICISAFFFRANWQGLIKTALLTVIFSFVLQCSFLSLQTGFLGTSIPTSSQVLKIENLIIPHIVPTNDSSIIELRTEKMKEPLQNFGQELIRVNGSKLFRVDLIPLQISTTLFALYGQNPKEVARKASNLSTAAPIPVYDMFANSKNFLILDKKSAIISSIQALPISVNNIFFPPDLYAAWSCDDPQAQISLFNRIRWVDHCMYEQVANEYRNFSRIVSALFALLTLLSFSRLPLSNHFTKLKLALTAVVFLVSIRISGFSLALGIYHSTSTRFLSWIAPAILFFVVSLFLKNTKTFLQK